MKKRILFHLILMKMLLIGTNLFGQGIQHQTITPPTPEATVFGKFGDIPVSFFTGTPNISIPIWEVNMKSLSLPISLSYHASGV